MRNILGSLALAAGFFSGIAAAEAATILMPAGSTVWMKMNSTACWNGVTTGADDCIASNQPGSGNGIPTSTFNGSGTFNGINATTSAEVLPDQVHSFVSGVSGFLHVSLEDTYTIHGSVPDPFSITAQLSLTGIMRTVGTGSCSICHQLVGATVQAEIGVFNHDSTNDINEDLRVTAFNSGATISYTANTIGASSPQSITFDITASYTLENLLVGDTFVLAYGINSAVPRGEIDMLNSGHISFILPEGVFLTSALGGEFGERADTSDVPVPAALPLFAGGLGLVALLARSRKRRTAKPIARSGSIRPASRAMIQSKGEAEMPRPSTSLTSRSRVDC